jgi:hypothetical protein
MPAGVVDGPQLHARLRSGGLRGTAVRIATWNLERPSLRSWKRLPRQRTRMAEVDADIWILTETRASIAPGQGYHGLHCPPHPARRPDADERWVSIWSRWPLRASGVPPDPRGAVSAVVESPDGELVIYGTVLPGRTRRVTTVGPGCGRSTTDRSDDKSPSGRRYADCIPTRPWWWLVTSTRTGMAPGGTAPGRVVTCSPGRSTMPASPVSLTKTSSPPGSYARRAWSITSPSATDGRTCQLPTSPAGRRPTTTGYTSATTPPSPSI